MQALRSVWKEGRRCSRCRAEVPCSPEEAHGGAGCSPVAHGHHIADLHVQLWRSPQWGRTHGRAGFQYPITAEHSLVHMDEIY